MTPVDQVLLIEVPAAPPSSPGPSEKPHRQAGGCPGVLFTVLSFILTMHQPVDFATPAIVDVSQMVFKDVLYRELL